jgi:hypothetical protein
MSKILNNIHIRFGSSNVEELFESISILEQEGWVLQEPPSKTLHNGYSDGDYFVNMNRKLINQQQNE